MGRPREVVDLVQERSRIRDALALIPSEERELWVRIGMAVKSALGEEGFDLWDEWSRRAQSYRESDARAVWRSIDPQGGITLGTLFFEARKYGNVPGAPITVGGVRTSPTTSAPRQGGERVIPPPIGCSAR